MSSEEKKEQQQKDSRHGHRQRLRKQYLKTELEDMRDSELLELLLFYAIPQRDTNPLVHRLLDVFGNLKSVLTATPEQLMTLGGLTENGAVLIKLITDLNRAVGIPDVSKERQLLTATDYGDYLAPRFQNKKDEQVYLLGLDAMHRDVGCHQLFAGTVNTVSFSSRKVVEAALNMKATGVVLAHNHPSGVAIPSKEDVQTTYTLYSVLGVMGISLLDHIIVADGDYVSMAESGLLIPPASPN
jgi:DNA repair protein RadC